MKTWLIALVMVIAAGCTSGVQSSDSSDTSVLESTSSATAVVSTTVVKTTIPQTTTSQTPTSTIPGCEIFVDSICPSSGVDPRLACLPNCDGVDFAGLIAPGLYFGDFSFEGANFTDASLIGASFYDDSKILGTIFTNADLSGSSFFSIFPVEASGVNLADAYFYRTCFRGTNLRGANFTNAFLPAASFVGANLTDVDFSGAKTIAEEDYDGEGFYGVTFQSSTVDGVIPSLNFGPTQSGNSLEIFQFFGSMCEEQ
jgi:hypothetical protein